MLMNGEVNLLVLDEPTNHLDLPSREWMEEALTDYEETLLFISHDRYFINRFATRIWEISGGTLTDFRGNYAAYIAGKASPAPAANSMTGKSRADKQKQKKDKQKSKPSDVQKEIRGLEREIEKFEKELEAVKLKKGIYSTDYEKLMELEGEEQTISGLLDDALEKWSELQ